MFFLWQIILWVHRFKLWVLKSVIFQVVIKTRGDLNLTARNPCGGGGNPCNHPEGRGAAHPLPLLSSVGVISNYMMLLLPHKELGRSVQNLNSGADLWRPFDSEPLHPAMCLLAEKQPPFMISEPSLASQVSNELKMFSFYRVSSPLPNV